MAHDLFLGQTKRDWSCGSLLESSLGKGGGEAAHKVAAGAGKVATGAGKVAAGAGKGLGTLARGIGKGIGALVSRKSGGSSRSSSRPRPSRSSRPSGRPSGIPFTHRLSNALIRHSRKGELKRYSRIEKKSAQGSPAHQKYVARQVALARQGNKKALAGTQAMKLARMVRLSSKTSTDRRYLSQGNKLAKGVLKKNPKAVRQYKQLQAAAGKGNPDAKKILAGAGLSAAVLATVATGRVALPKSNTSKQKAALSKQVVETRRKALAGKITKEEAEAGAKAAKQLGDRQTEAYLSQAAQKAPPAKTETKPVAKPPTKQEQEPGQEHEDAQAISPGPDNGESAPGESAPGEGTASSPDEIQELYTKLWTEHAHQLVQQDQASHLRPKSLESYETLSKLWAKREIAKQGIPTSRLAGNLDDDRILLPPQTQDLPYYHLEVEPHDDEDEAQSEDCPGRRTL